MKSKKKMEFSNSNPLRNIEAHTLFLTLNTLEAEDDLLIEWKSGETT